MTTNTQRKTPARDSVLARFMLGFDGESLSSEMAGYLSQGLAGVALYPRNFRSPDQLRELTQAIREAAQRPILIGIDQEGGTRFALKSPFTVWPSAADLGRLGDCKLIKQVAQAMALEIRAAGCNLNFAPMLDLHINPESPVTRDRSFGIDPDRVAELGTAFHEGLRAGGVLSCAKHFPGHGDASIDPHLDLPVFAGTVERLESADLIPFAAAIAAEIPTIMTAHILLPAIDSKYPASLSRTLLNGTLRERMGFRGVILADDLGMGAIARHRDILGDAGDPTVQTLRAGTDIAMLCHQWSSVAPAIASVRKSKEARLFERVEWEASLDRVENLCKQAESPETQPPLGVIGCAEHQELASEIRKRLSA